LGAFFPPLLFGKKRCPAGGEFFRSQRGISAITINLFFDIFAAFFQESGGKEVPKPE
jgi:hypothetical protein